MLLVVGEALRRRELLFFAMRLVLVDHGNGVDHVCALVGEERVDIDKLPAPMDQAAQVHRLVLVFLGGIGRQAIGHPLDGRETGVAMGKEIVEILARVPAPGEVQTDRLLPFEAQDRGVHPLALRLRVGLIFLDQRQDARAGVVLVDQRLLGAETLEVFKGRIGAIGDLLDQLPLGGIGQRHTHQLLKGLDAFERQAQMIMGHGQIDLQAHIVGFLTRLGWHVGHKQGAARPAARLLQFIADDLRQRKASETQAHQGA